MHNFLYVRLLTRREMLRRGTRQVRHQCFDIPDRLAVFSAALKRFEGHDLRDILHVMTAVDGNASSIRITPSPSGFPLNDFNTLGLFTSKFLDRDCTFESGFSLPLLLLLLLRRSKSEYRQQNISQRYFWRYFCQVTFLSFPSLAHLIPYPENYVVRGVTTEAAGRDGGAKKGE